MSEEDNNAQNNIPEVPTTENGGEFAPEPDKNGGGNKNGKSDFMQRALTGLFIAVLYVVPIVLGFYVHELFYDALVVFLMIVASYEFSKAISVKFAKPINVFIYLNIILGYTAFKLVDEFVGKGSGGITSFFGMLAVSFIACIVYNMFSKKNNINNVVSTLFVMIYPGAIMTYLLSLNYLPERFCAVAIIIAFLSATLTDTMAYLVGSTLKGPKLCPKISPKKTISGAIGGLLGGIIGGAIAFAFGEYGILTAQPLMEATVPNVLNFLFLGLGASLFCQIGDLISSYVKRACGIKDFGNILKGHGGFMDRIDGLIITAVFIFIYFKILGVVIL